MTQSHSATGSAASTPSTGTSWAPLGTPAASSTVGCRIGSTVLASSAPAGSALPAYAASPYRSVTAAEQPRTGFAPGERPRCASPAAGPQARRLPLGGPSARRRAFITRPPGSPRTRRWVASAGAAPRHQQRPGPPDSPDPADSPDSWSAAY